MAVFCGEQKSSLEGSPTKKRGAIVGGPSRSDLGHIKAKILSHSATMHALQAICMCQIALNRSVSYTVVVISPLNHLRRQIARAHLGLRVFACLMVLSLGMAGMVSGEIHTHKQAAVDHHHHADWDVDSAPAMPDADDLPATSHFHDAPIIVTQAILSSELNLLPSLAPSSVFIRSPDSLRHVCLSSPPHRPPIV